MIVVNISDCKIVSGEAQDLITYSLGSCLGVSVFDPVTMVGGLIHCMLPLAKIAESKPNFNPLMFVDTGFTFMLNELFKMGASKKNLVVKAAGCAEFMDPQHYFNIGERNFTVFRKILWKNGIILKNSDVGGKISRTVILRMKTGQTLLRSGGKEWEL
jgi:chemotaxis protein CheD